MSKVTTQTAGIVPENIAPLINDGASDISTGLASFLTDALQNEDLSAPRGFLIYITFDADMNVISDQSDILPVSSPNQLEFLQSEQLVMPENGYFYTYLTNTSDQLVSFDNLTVHHKQGRVRALYDYYPYGLMWSNVRDDQYDNTFEGSEFAHGEWGISGLNMNYFEARWYDPALGRWHSPDPLEQFHSPYVGMANDPANFIDPDGRNAREWLEITGIVVGSVASCYLLAGAPGLSIALRSVGKAAVNVLRFVGTALVVNTALAIERLISKDPNKPIVSVGLNVNLGTHNNTIGVEVSLTNKLSDYTYLSSGIGVSGVGSYCNTGKSGMEIRASSLLGYDNGPTGLSLGTTRFGGTDGMKEFAQRTGMLNIKAFRDFRASYENDGMPFALDQKKQAFLGDGNDSYRTAAVKLSYSKYELGFNLFTGKRIDYSFDKDRKNRSCPGNFGQIYPHDQVQETGPKYRYGSLYGGTSAASFGIESDRWVLFPIQTRGAHNLKIGPFSTQQPGFDCLSDTISFKFQYFYSNFVTDQTRFTLWRAIK